MLSILCEHFTSTIYEIISYIKIVIGLEEFSEDISEESMEVMMKVHRKVKQENDTEVEWIKG